MRHLYLGAATALMLGLAGCGGIYGEHSDESYRSNAGFTRENPAPVGPPVPGPAIGPGGRSDVGENPGHSAPGRF